MLNIPPLVPAKGSADPAQPAQIGSVSDAADGFETVFHDLSNDTPGERAEPGKTLAQTDDLAGDNSIDPLKLSADEAADTPEHAAELVDDPEIELAEERHSLVSASESSAPRNPVSHRGRELVSEAENQEGFSIKPHEVVPSFGTAPGISDANAPASEKNSALQKPPVPNASFVSLSRTVPELQKMVSQQLGLAMPANTPPFSSRPDTGAPNSEQALSSPGAVTRDVSQAAPMASATQAPRESGVPVREAPPTGVTTTPGDMSRFGTSPQKAFGRPAEQEALSRQIGLGTVAHTGKTPDAAALPAVAQHSGNGAEENDSTLRPPNVRAPADANMDQEHLRYLPVKDRASLVRLMPAETSPAKGSRDMSVHSMPSDPDQHPANRVGKTSNPPTPIAKAAEAGAVTLQSSIAKEQNSRQDAAIPENFETPIGRGDEAHSSTPAGAPHRPDSALHRPETPIAIARQLTEQASQAHSRTVELRLNPEELGRVQMSLVTGEDSIVVSISTERPETLALMRRHIDQLGQEFQRIGYANVSFSFEGQAGSGGNGREPDKGFPPPASDRQETVASPRSSDHRPVSGVGLDIRI